MHVSLIAYTRLQEKDPKRIPFNKGRQSRLVTALYQLSKISGLLSRAGPANLFSVIDIILIKRYQLVNLVDTNFVRISLYHSSWQINCSFRNYYKWHKI